MGHRNYKYRPEFCQIVVDAMIKGASVDSIGCRLISEDSPYGVARSTVYQWIKDIPEFAEAIEHGNHLAQIRLEEALGKKAIGDKNGKAVDYQSASFLLKTRFHKTYSEKTVHEVGESVSKLIIEGLDE